MIRKVIPNPKKIAPKLLIATPIALSLSSLTASGQLSFRRTGAKTARFTETIYANRRKERSRAF